MRSDRSMRLESYFHFEIGMCSFVAQTEGHTTSSSHGLSHRISAFSGFFRSFHAQGRNTFLRNDIQQSDTAHSFGNRTACTNLSNGPLRMPCEAESSSSQEGCIELRLLFAEPRQR